MPQDEVVRDYELNQKPMVSIDTPDGLEHFKICQCIARLRLETSTGLKFKTSTLRAVQTYYGVTARTKKGALAELETLYKEVYGKPYGRPT